MSEIGPGGEPIDPINEALQHAYDLLDDPDVVGVTDFDQMNRHLENLAIRGLYAQTSLRSVGSNRYSDVGRIPVYVQKLIEAQDDHLAALRHDDVVKPRIVEAGFDEVITLTEPEEVLSAPDYKAVLEKNLTFLGLSMARRCRTPDHPYVDISGWLRSQHVTKSLQKGYSGPLAHIRALRLPPDEEQLVRRFTREKEISRDFVWRTVLAATLADGERAGQTNLVDVIIALRNPSTDLRDPEVISSISSGERIGFSPDYLSNDPTVKKLLL
jgi:hypothetical protein